MKFYSIKNRLFLYTFTITFVSWVLIIGVVILGLRDLIISLTEESLEVRSGIVASAIPLGYLEDNSAELNAWLDEVAKNPPEFVNTGIDNDSSYQIWYNNEKIAQSYNSPIMPIPTAEGPDFFFDETQDETIVWMTHARKIKGKDAWAVAIEDMEFVFEGTFPFTLIVFVFIGENFPLIYLLLPLIFIALFWGVKRSLSDLVEVSEQLSTKERKDYSILSFENNPHEIRSLIDRVNYCYEELQRSESEVKASLESEKRFTANAAHELLTPLAAIKSEAQLRERQTDDPQQKEGLQAISLRVDRATHTVEQLVSLARLDPSTLQEQFEEIDLGRVLQNTSADLGNKISEKNIDFHVTFAKDSSLKGLTSALGLLCRNVVDNAVRYCPEGGVVSIEVISQEATKILRVKNSGRPIPDYLKEYIFDRFVRGPGEEETGSGLGMSIIKRVAEIHKAEVILSDPIEFAGVQIDIVFPT